jgi:2-polyprenyl-3-methyl-5-hydroxy-6-metoxy-1,4-benzoquinol methylase
MSNQVEQGFFSPFLQRARLAVARPHLKGQVLDIGCGNGALAAFVSPDRYLGVDRDKDALNAARRKHSSHRFVGELPEHGAFDTVVGLAIIEHLKEPQAALSEWSGLLSEQGRILLTTPHRSFRAVHELGSRLGLFSQDAADEHEEMFDRDSLSTLAQGVGLNVQHYVRFLAGANQLFILAPRH